MNIASQILNLSTR